MENWILEVGIGAAVTIGVAAFLRFCPKAKLLEWIQPKAEVAGKIVSKVLALRLGPKAAESLEEGVIVTLMATVYAGITSFMKGLLSDNENRNI